jgi:capsular polysaccharide biosynthesis protein
MGQSNQRGVRAFSEKVFRRLLFLYPKKYRDGFGPSMQQLFRDQGRDAWAEARSRGLLKLWLRVLPDLLRTSACEHITALKEKSMNERIAALLRSRSAPRKAFFAVFPVVFLIVFGVTALITFLSPPAFSSTSRIRLECDSPDLKPGDPGAVIVYDPYFIQTEFEVIRSDVVLNRAIERLNLNVLWRKEYAVEASPKKRELLAMLRKSIELRPIRNTMLIEIGAYSDKPEKAAAIANAIAEAYRDHRLEEQYRQQAALAANLAPVRPDQTFPRVRMVEIIDRAVPDPDPVRPRKALNLFVGAIAGIVLGLIAGGTSGGMALLLGKKLRARPAVQM